KITIERGKGNGMSGHHRRMHSRLVFVFALLAMSTAATGAVHAATSPVDKCKETIAKSSATLVQARIKILQKCEESVVKGKLTVSKRCLGGPNTVTPCTVDSECPGSVCTACGNDLKTLDKLGKANAKLQSSVTKACGGKDKACGTGDDITPAAAGFPATCPNFENNP